MTTDQKPTHHTSSPDETVPADPARVARTDTATMTIVSSPPAPIAMLVVAMDDWREWPV